jgi:hypothetical protein
MCMRSAVRRSSRASITARRKRLGAARALRRCGCKQKHPVSSDDRTMVTQRGGGRQRWRTMRWGCHLANGGARLGTACPAVVGSRGKVSAGTAENRETQQRGGDAQRRRGITHASSWTCVCVHRCVRVPAAKRGGKPTLSGTRHRKGRERTQAASKGARSLRKAVAPAKRPARHDGWLSSDGGSARRREAGVVQQRALKA